MKPRLRLLGLLTALTLWWASPLSGQGTRQPAVVETGLILRQLDGVKRVLVVAAHPDDEDTSLLTALARGWGAETAYFSFTRGEGGQNAIGPELREGLGIIRSEELLAARQIDGAGQFFGRAFDFGYSKSPEETLDKWPRDIVLSDLVWTIRTFRPQVLITMWGGTPNDGHGQHQVSGRLAIEAFDAAADPDRFPDQLEDGVDVWRIAKLYQRPLFDPEVEAIEVNTGTLDPLLGLSHHQVAMASRSQHRSQDFGTVLPPGPRAARIALVEARISAVASGDLFSGIDTTLTTLARDLPAGASELIRGYRRSIAEATRTLHPTRPADAFPALARAKRTLSAVRAMVPSERDELARELTRRDELLDRAILSVAGVRLEARARDDVLVPGQTVLVETRVWSGNETTVELMPPAYDIPAGWQAAALDPAEDVDPDDTGPFGRFFRQQDPVADPLAEAVIAPGSIALWRTEVTVPDDAEPTTPYFLGAERDGDVYRWPDEPDLRSLPFRPPLLSSRARLTLELDGTSVEVDASQPVRFRGVDGALGEFWRPIQVAPRVAVVPEAETLVWPTNRGGTQRVAFNLTNRDVELRTGTLEIEVPTGWRATPAASEFTLQGDGGETRLVFSIEPPEQATEGEFFVRPILNLDVGTAPTVAVTVIDYPHIEPHLIVGDPAIRVVRFPVQVADRLVGYVMGSGDDGPDAIRQLGMDVELIESEWSREHLDRFDTIVLGVRAYEVRDDLIAANPELLRWVEAGGTLVVQYNRYAFNQGQYAPFPLFIDPPAPRVTDELAEVTLLEEAAPPLVSPNRIGPADFEGWVQERGLYFPSEWDDRYQALLEMADPGEAPQRGSLLASPHGEGLYIHTSLSFFRQFRAGVAGAYRLWANLLSLDGRTWREITTS